MKIGLINPPHSYKADKSNINFYHLGGIGFVDAVLRQEGHEVKNLDFAHNSNSLLEEIDNCNVVGVGSYLDSYGFLKKTLPKLKGKKIIVGGSLISSYGLNDNNLLMRTFPEIDFGVIGEGEKTTKDLVSFLEKKGDLPSGVVYRTNGSIKTTKKQKQIENLDKLPEIEYSIWPFLSEKINKNIFDLNTSRGCYSACSFCFKIFPKVRGFSLKRVERDLEKISRLKPSSLYISDDTFSYNKERSKGIGKLLQKFGIPYRLETRVTDVDKDLLKVLKETGCLQVKYGIESFDENILKKVSKNITRNQIDRAINLTQEAGIETLGFFIVGLPGENKNSLETTIKGIEKTKILPRARLLMPLPGTRIYTEALKDGKINEEELLEQFSKPGQYDTAEGSWVPINLSDGLSDAELIEARDQIKELRDKLERK